MSTTHINEPTEPNAKSKDGPLLETISLRDYFAAKAMQGFVSDQDWRIDMAPDETARAAYAQADAMLEARKL